MVSALESPRGGSFLRKLRVLGMVEGSSTLILFFVAMPLKYAAGMPLAVRIVGSLHGLLFVCLVGMFLLAIKKVPLSARMAAFGIIAAVLPFGPFVFDRWLSRMEEASVQMEGER